MQDVRFSQRLQQAIRVGMVSIDSGTQQATILAPPNSDQLKDDDWLLILQAASEVRTELEQLDYTTEG